ncbi:MAG TPA: hypothetical protein VKS81_02780 [Bacteroidota bacterium]|nr:hypothetical protein [Bacteroidota bacterium]
MILRFAPLLLIAVAPAFQSCNIFETGTPQSPNQGNSSYQSPVTPDIVLQNLVSAVAESNLNNYLLSFPDTTATTRRFQFVPSPEVASTYASVFRSWSVSDERTYFQNLGSPVNGAPNLDIPTDQPPQVNTPDSVVYSLNYTLFYPTRNHSVPQSVQGRMQLNLRSDAQGKWAIYYWQDFKTTNDSTWSYLKAVFSGGS